MRQLKITRSITNRDSATLDKYLHDIVKENLNSIEEEVELARRARQGDRKALEQQINGNLRFVVSVAKMYQHQGLSLPDLISEGNIGLIKAAERYDETKGFKFISYAVNWIRQSIQQAIAEQSRMVRLPQNKIGHVNKINKEVSRFEQEHGRRPSTEEISERLNMSEDKIDEVLMASTRHISADTPLANDDTTNLIDTMACPDSSTTDRQLVLESLRTEIDNVLRCLNTREREVTELFFGINGKEMTLDEIGTKMGLTRERVRQIKERAIRQLRKNTNNKLLKSYLGQ